MRIRILILFFIVLGFTSCFKEYEIFIPYKNTNLSYLSDIQDDFNTLEFKNNVGFRHVNIDGSVISIEQNAFPEIYNELKFQWRLLNSKKNLVAGRISMNDKYKNYLSHKQIIEFKIIDSKGKNISKEILKTVEFRFPAITLGSVGIYRYESDYWAISKSAKDNLTASNWNVNTEAGEINLTGILFTTSESGIIGLGTTTEKINLKTDIMIVLDDNFDVNNSIVQIVSKEKNFNYELSWDTELKAFVLPDNELIANSEKFNVIVLSEDIDHNPFFGMELADITDNTLSNYKINVYKSNIMDINEALKKL
jgi:hypothetical protein